MAYIRIFCLSILFLLPPVVEAQDDAYLPLSDEDLQTRHTAGFILTTGNSCILPYRVHAPDCILLVTQR